MKSCSWTRRSAPILAMLGCLFTLASIPSVACPGSHGSGPPDLTQVNPVVLCLLPSAPYPATRAVQHTIIPCDSGLTEPSIRPVYYKGSIEIKAPTWNSDHGYIHDWRLLEIGGDLRIYNLFGPSFQLVPFVSGEHSISPTLGPGYPRDNELKAGLEYPIGQGSCLFTYWDRRFGLESDRVFVGFRIGFQGGGGT